jgi:RsiW-degrading membrane proteinase PrsW (M82 family)
MWCFVVGGALGVVAASVLEFRTLLDLRALPTIAIGLIEESCKLVIPLLIFFAFPRFRREADGLLFGVASGLGFAAFESMGYGLTALLRSGGDIGATEQMLFVRTVLSPAGHGAWTGLICAALWRAREGGASWSVVPIAFAVAVVLHALWDSIQHPWQQAIIAVISFSLLIWRLRAASEPRPAARRAGVDFRRHAPLTP